MDSGVGDMEGRGRFKFCNFAICESNNPKKRFL